METVETTSQNGEFRGRQTILLNLGNSWYLTPESCLENKSCKIWKYLQGM